MHISLWAGVVTLFLKEFFALPRPANVDAAVLLPGTGVPNPTPLKGMGAHGFFQGLPQQAIDYCRAHRIDSFGFPSGHTSSAVALWGSVLLLFKHKRARFIAVVFLLAIPLSRLYLGRHFLADILGGFLVGSAVLLLFYYGVYRQQALYTYLFIKNWIITWQWRTLLTVGYFLVAPFLLLLLPLNSRQPENGILMSALLLGMNLSFLLIWKRGLPVESGTYEQRALRIVLGLLLFLIIQVVLKGLSGLLFKIEPDFIRFIRLTLTFFISFGGGIEWGIKLRLFEREKVSICTLN